MLKIGIRSPEVIVLQKILGNLKIDGIFGKLTENRLNEVFGKNEIKLNEINKTFVHKIIE